LVNFNKRYSDFTNNFNDTKELLNDTIGQMNCIGDTVSNLERLRIEKIQREEELIKDSNSEATTFEQLIIKVGLISKSMRDEVALKSWVESLLDTKMTNMEKKFEQKINTTKSELEAKIKETSKSINSKINVLDKKISTETDERLKAMTNLQDKFNKMSTDINAQIK
jgi:hypothetical protein